MDFNSVQDLNHHFDTCSEKSPEELPLELECNKCDLIFKSTDLLILHLGLDHGVEKPAVCDICGLILTWQKHLPRHKRTVHSDVFEPKKSKNVDYEYEIEQEFHCSMCKSSCVSRVNLELHLLKKHNICEFLCGNCGKIFQDVENLNSHESECDIKESDDFPCNACEKVWKSSHALALHLGMAHGVLKPAVCEICGQILYHPKQIPKHKASKHGLGQSYKKSPPKAKKICKKSIKLEGNNGNQSEENTEMKSEVMESDETKPEVSKAMIPEVTISEKPEIPKAEGKYECDLCQTNLVSMNQKHKCVKNKSSYERFCSICKKTYSSLSAWSKHIKTKHSETNEVFMCDKCEYSSYAKHLLTQHIRNVHEKEKYSHCCSVCGKKFPSKIVCETHELKCSKGTQNVTCSDCNMTMKSERSYLLHRKNVHGEILDGSITCETCGKGFSTLRNCQLHRQRAHPTDSELAAVKCQCKKCKMDFSTSEELNNHQRKCLDNPWNLKCPECKSPNWCSGEALSKHSAEIHRQYLYVCDDCGTIFKNDASLGAHKKTHGPDAKLFKCNHCEKTFLQKVGMFNHMLNAHGDTSVPHNNCGYCDYKCWGITQLNAHINSVHTKEKVYSCKICNYTSFKSHNISKHMKKVHERKLEQPKKKLYMPNFGL